MCSCIRSCTLAFSRYFARRNCCLKKEDCWENNNDLFVGKGIFKDSKKLRYVTEAFKLHSADEQYVFRIKKEGRWRKLNERSLQIKLNYIICVRILVLHTGRSIKMMLYFLPYEKRNQR